MSECRARSAAYSTVLLLGVLCAWSGAGEAPPCVPEREGLAALARSGIEQVVFTTRLTYDDPHWYANIGYYCDDAGHKAYAGNGKPD